MPNIRINIEGELTHEQYEKLVRYLDQEGTKRAGEKNLYLKVDNIEGNPPKYKGVEISFKPGPKTIPTTNEREVELLQGLAALIGRF